MNEINETELINELIKMLQDDLKNEYAHMHFYMQAGVLVQGLHREELGEYFLEEAASEQKHCEEFSRKLIGLGGKLPCIISIGYLGLPVNDFPHPINLLEYALKMESDVVKTFHERLKRCAGFNFPQATVIGLFYEDQIMDSYKSVEHIKEMLK